MRSLEKMDRGETKMKWQTGLPRKSGAYVCEFRGNVVTILQYSDKHKVFNCIDDFDKEGAELVNMNEAVIKWIPLDYFIKNEEYYKNHIL